MIFPEEITEGFDIPEGMLIRKVFEARFPPSLGGFEGAKIEIWRLANGDFYETGEKIYIPQGKIDKYWEEKIPQFLLEGWGLRGGKLVWKDY